MPDVAFPDTAGKPDRMDDDLRRLLHHWRALAGPGGVPDAATLDLVTLPFPLADILVMSTGGSPFQFRFDYTGSRWMLRFRREMTGRRLDELVPDAMGRRLSDALARAVGTTAPTCDGKAAGDDRIDAGPMLILPFRGALGRADTFLVAIAPQGTA